MEQLKEKYNYNLKRIEKTLIYFDRKDISIEDKEIQLDLFRQLLEEQNKLMNVLGLVVGQAEVIEGFRS